jgi:hypothetical protein
MSSWWSTSTTWTHRILVDRPVVDYCLSLLVVGLFWLGLAIKWPSVLDDVVANATQHGTWQTWTQTLAAVTGSLLGLGVAAIAVLFAVSPGRGLRKLLGAVGTELNRLLVISIRSVAATTAIFALMVPLEPGGLSKTAFLVLMAVAVFAASRLGRLLYLFRQLVDIFMSDMEGDVEDNTQEGRP